MSGKEYTPFGKEWGKEALKFTKNQLVQMLKKSLITNQDNAVAIKIWEKLKDKVNPPNGCFSCHFGEFPDCAIGGDITNYWNNRGKRPDACITFFGGSNGKTTE